MLFWIYRIGNLRLRYEMMGSPRHAVLDRDPHESEYWEPGHC